MINETQIKELESALRARAEALAAEYRARGEAERERIIRDMQEKLRRREQREVQAAKALADRTYQQRVQAGELKMQAAMDRLRWTLVEGVIEAAKTRLRELAADEAAYLPHLGALFAAAVGAIPGRALVVRVNRQDQQRLARDWAGWCRQWAPGRELRLDDEPLDCLGGVLVEDEDRRVRVDNTFEGRIERLGDTLQQLILERLFVSVPEMGAFANG